MVFIVACWFTGMLLFERQFGSFSAVCTNYHSFGFTITSASKMTTIEIKSTVKVFGGQLIRFSHASSETNTTMTCAVYLPNELGRSHDGSKIPSILYLSGLTCTDENVCQKSGVFRKLSELQVCSICPEFNTIDSLHVAYLT